jgi:hypothetical protein
MRPAFVAAAAIVCGGCGSKGGQPPVPTVPPANASSTAPPAELAAACASAALRVAVTPPGTDDATATLAIHWDGEHDANPSKEVCIVRGSDIELVPRGEVRRVDIRAHATELQRVVVGTLPHLIAAVPDASLSLLDNPCFGYEIGGPNTDGWFAEPPIAYCEKPGQECRAGFSRAPTPRLSEDPLCGETEDEIRRCVADTVIGFASGAAPRPPKPPAEDFTESITLAELAAQAPILIAPRRCGFYTIDTGKDIAALVVGAGERWELSVDDAGALRGTHRMQ